MRVNIMHSCYTGFDNGHQHRLPPPVLATATNYIEVLVHTEVPSQLICVWVLAFSTGPHTGHYHKLHRGVGTHRGALSADLCLVIGF